MVYVSVTRPQAAPLRQGQHTFDSIIVPLDGSPEALNALRLARLLATVFQVVIRIVHVTPARAPKEGLAQRLGLGEEHLRGVVLDQMTGKPADLIVHAATERRHPLLVMATHRRKGRQRVVGATVRQVLQRAPCPVVLVPPGTQQRFRGREERLRRILLPLDAAADTVEGTCPTAVLARHSRAEVVVLHVVTARQRPVRFRGSLGVPRYLDHVEEWPAWANEFLTRMFACAPWGPLPLHLVVRSGDPAEEVLQAAAEYNVDLVALVWHGHLEKSRASVVKAVVRETPCPVLLTRISAPARA